MLYIFVVNGRADFVQRINDDLSKQLEGCTIEHKTYVTTGVGDGTRFVRLYCDLHPNEEVCFVACGGCGMANEVASGIIGETNKYMAILAYGYTNDFIKYYPDLDFHSFEKILQGELHPIDAIRVNDSYAINACHFGFDSIVASEANYQTEQGHSKPYLRGIIKGIFMGRFNKIKVVADGQKLNKRRMLLCTLANSKYVGGEFLCAPRAKNDDGLIEVCLIKTMLLINFLRLIPIYTKGEHLEHKFYKKKIAYCRAKHIEIKSSSIIEVCLDGELLPGTNFTVDIVPSSVNLILPKN